MTAPPRRHLFVRMFGSALVIQALLSATSFFVGLVLLRRTSDFQYGSYVLITNATLLATALMNASVQPPLVMRMTGTDAAGRAELIGGLYRDLRAVLMRLTLALLGLVLVLWITGLTRFEAALMSFAGIASLIAGVYRESFRLVLMAYRRSQDALKADGVYVVLVLVGVPLATLAPAPAATAVFVLAVAAVVSGRLMSGYLWRAEPWNRHSRSQAIRELAPVGAWSGLGAATHWAFSQGYNYVVAGVLDVPSVAALAAIRLLMMPINLMSSGITSLMMATASHWLRDHGPGTLFRRLWLISAGLAGMALCYLAVLWLVREPLFIHVLHKSFPDRDRLFLIWSVVFIVMLFRDQLQFLPGASSRYRSLTISTAIAAGVSLTSGFFAIRSIGVMGAPIGVLIGELANVTGIIILSIQCMRRGREPVLAP